MTLGINQSNLTQLSASDLDRVLGDIADFGFTSVRFSADWGNLSSWLTGVNYAPLRAVAAGLTKHGLTPLPIVGVHLPWLLNNSVSQFATFVRTCVDIFGDAPAYEVWNEPNLPAFNIGSPANYLKYLRAAAPIIRGVGSTVISAGLAATGNGIGLLGRSYAPVDWLTALYAAGENGDYDQFGYHPYALTPTAWADPAMTPFGIAQLAKMDVVRAAHGDTRPYAFTELGYDTAKVGLTSACNYLPKQLDQLAGYNADTWLFCWRDAPANDGGSYGLVDKNSAPKQPYYQDVWNRK